MQDGAVLASLRSEDRYAIDDIQLTRVSVAVPAADGEPNQYEASLADLSLRGVRLAMEEKLLTGQKVLLRLSLPAIGVDWTREATVVWTDPRDAESWWIGCSLDEPLERETIDRMAVARIVDRRRDSRYSVAELGQIRWELSEEVRDVRVVNFSKGGFCVVGPDDASMPSERVMLLLEQDNRRAKVPARVMWDRPTSEGHALGCAFTTRDGFLRLREFLEPDGSPRRRASLLRCGGKARLTRWVVLAVAVLCTAEFLQLVGGQPQLWQAVRASFVARVIEPIQAGWQGVWAETPSDQRSSSGD